MSVFDVDLQAPVFDLTVPRGFDARVRVTIEEDGAPKDLTGATLQFVAKNRPGGTTKLNVAFTLETQSGDTLGQATATLPRGQLVGLGAPNADPTEELSWVYQVTRLQDGLLTCELRGTLTLGATI